LVKGTQRILAGYGVTVVDDGSLIGKEVHPALKRRAAVCLAKSRSALSSSFSRAARTGVTPLALGEAVPAGFVWKSADATVNKTMVARKKRACFMCAPGGKDSCRDQSNRQAIGESV